MYRYFILFCLIASQADAQSIVMSGGNSPSIVVSGKIIKRIHAPEITLSKPPLQTLNETRLEDLEYRLDFLESTLKAAMEKPAVIKTTETIVVPVKKRQRQWFLVSESWCPNCPRAKTVFRSKGWPDSNVLTIAQCEQRFGFRPPHVPFEFGEPNWNATDSSVQTRPVSVRGTTGQKQRLPVVDTQWGRIDLETYSRNCNCSMCVGIRRLQQQYRSMGRYQTMSYEPDLPPGQQPTPQDVVEEMVSLMQLTKNDVLADLGCGHDARILIEAVETTGCRGIGIEIDPVAAESARRSVADAGLSGLISINPDQDGNTCSDALEFVPERHGVTAITAYLYEDLLQKLAPKMQSVRVSASPYHQAFPGMVRHGDVWIWRK